MIDNNDSSARRLSALIDGELESHELVDLWSAMRRDPIVTERWSDYALVGDALRGEVTLGRDIVGQVMTELREEPIVLSPRCSVGPAWPRPVLALAASLAGVAVVAWIAFSPQSPASFRGAPELAAVRSEVSPAQPTAARDMREYLAAHQTHSSVLSLHGGTQHIRTVSAAAGGAGR